MATFVPLNTKLYDADRIVRRQLHDQPGSLDRDGDGETIRPRRIIGSAQAATVTLSGTNTVGSVTGILNGWSDLANHAGTYAVTATFVPTDTNSTTLTG